MHLHRKPSMSSLASCDVLLRISASLSLPAVQEGPTQLHKYVCTCSDTQLLPHITPPLPTHHSPTPHTSLPHSHTSLPHSHTSLTHSPHITHPLPIHHSPTPTHHSPTPHTSLTHSPHITHPLPHITHPLHTLHHIQHVWFFLFPVLTLRVPSSPTYIGTASKCMTLTQLP